MTPFPESLKRNLSSQSVDNGDNVDNSKNRTLSRAFRQDWAGRKQAVALSSLRGLE